MVFLVYFDRISLSALQGRTFVKYRLASLCIHNHLKTGASKVCVWTQLPLR